MCTKPLNREVRLSRIGRPENGRDRGLRALAHSDQIATIRLTRKGKSTYVTKRAVYFFRNLARIGASGPRGAKHKFDINHWRLQEAQRDRGRKGLNKLV